MTERHIGRGWPNLIPVGILLLTSATTHAEGADGARGIGSHEVARSIVDYQFNEVGHVVYTTRTIGLFGTSYKRFETICDGSRMTLSLGSGDTYDEALQNSLTKGNAALLIFLADD